MLIQDLKEILQDQPQIFEETYFYTSPIDQLTIKYRFKQTNHDILLNFLF